MKKKYGFFFKTVLTFINDFLEKETFKKRIVLFFTKNFVIKVIALIGAFFLFAYLKSSNIEEVTFSIPLKTNLPRRTILMSDIPDRVNVTYTGNKSSLANFDINSLYAEISPEKVDKRHAVDIKVKGHLENIKVKKIDPESIRLTISKMNRKRLEIKPEFINSPAETFEHTSYSITPQYLWVDGPKTIIKELTYLRTTSISLKGLDASKEIDVDISQTTHPSLIFDREQKYVVRINIEKKREVIKSLKEYDVFLKNMDVFTNATGFNIDSYIDTLKVSNVKYISYSALSARTIEKRLQFYIDCSTLKQNGNYQLPIAYEKLTNIVVESYQPSSININITNL